MAGAEVKDLRGARSLFLFVCSIYFYQDVFDGALEFIADNEKSVLAQIERQASRPLYACEMTSILLDISVCAWDMDPGLELSDDAKYFADEIEGDERPTRHEWRTEELGVIVRRFANLARKHGRDIEAGRILSRMPARNLNGPWTR